MKLIFKDNIEINFFFLNDFTIQMNTNNKKKPLNCFQIQKLKMSSFSLHAKYPHITYFVKIRKDISKINFQFFQTVHYFFKFILEKMGSQPNNTINVLNY